MKKRQKFNIFSFLFIFCAFCLLLVVTVRFFDIFKEKEPETGPRPPSSEWGDSSVEDSASDSSGAGSEDIPPEEDPETFTVNYVMVEGSNTIKPVHSFLWEEYGSYPTTYTEGQALQVSTLKAGNITYFNMENFFEGTTASTDGYSAEYWLVDPTNPHKEYQFRGWYLDPDCTKAYSVSERYSGNLTLYAKVAVATWIGPY